jgi:hypothetical protein
MSQRQLRSKRRGDPSSILDAGTADPSTPDLDHIFEGTRLHEFPKHPNEIDECPEHGVGFPKYTNPIKSKW